MKKFFTLGVFGVVAVFLTLPAPAAAGFWDRDSGEGVRFEDRLIVRWAARRRGIDLSDGSSSPGYHRWGTYSNPSYYYYPANDYPEAPPVDVNAVTIRMHVPADARVWFEGAATSQTGENRDFVSPSLTPGRPYVYHIRVQWTEDSKPVERKRDVSVHAGDRITLNFER